MRKTVLGAIGAAILSAGFSTASTAADLDLSDPDDIMRANMKTSCTFKDGKPVSTVFWFGGRAWSRRPGEADRLLFKVSGMNVRQCARFEDPVKGVGVRAVSREILLYLDPETKEVLRTWTNPWTDEEVNVIHVANDPVNSRSPRFARNDAGEAVAKFRSWELGDYFLNGGEAARLFYKNPMGGEYQDYVGGTYHAAEFINGFSPKSDILNGDLEADIDRVISWGRVSKWLPWMKMGDRDGVMIFVTVGTRVGGIDELPEPLLTELRTNYPIYAAPPPLDDARPNDTTWTITKRAIDAMRAEGDEAEAEAGH